MAQSAFVVLEYPLHLNHSPYVCSAPLSSHIVEGRAFGSFQSISISNSFNPDLLSFKCYLGFLNT